MKIIFIICTLSLFNSILTFKKEFDLINGYSKRIEQLEEGTNYYLYISAIKYQKFQISLIMNNLNNRPFSYLYIYEKTSKFNNYYDKSTFYPVKTNIENNKLKITIPYIVSAINSGYVTIKFTPLYNISYMNIEINGNKNNPNDLPSYIIYNLKNNLTQNYYNLTKDIKYYFILEAQFLMTAKIKIDMNLLSSSLSTNYNYITAQEIKNKDNIFDFNNDKTYTLSAFITNKVKYNFNPIEYTIVNPSSKYLLLNFIPKNNISSFSIKVDIKGEIYNISKNFARRIYNSNSDIPYYFILESNEEYHSVNIAFKSNIFINYLEYYELADKFSSIKFNYSIWLRNDYAYNNNEKHSSFLYNFDSTYNKDKKIIFKLDSLNFNYLDINFDFYYIINKTINFGNNIQLFNLVKGNKYFFKSYSSEKNINIIMTLNDKYMYSNILPFKYLIIKEYSSSKYENYYYIRSSNKTISKTINNGKYTLTCSHSLYYYSAYLLIQVIPNENIPNFNIKINNLYINNGNTQKTSSTSYKKKNKPFIIAMIIVPILIVIIIIIIICYKCKKNSNQLNELNLDNLNKNNDVYSINDSIKNNEDEQPNYNNHQEDHQSYQEFNDYSYNKNQNDIYMFPYDQAYGGQNRNDQQYFNPPNNNQNIGNFSIY